VPRRRGRKWEAHSGCTRASNCTWAPCPGPSTRNASL